MNTTATTTTESTVATSQTSFDLPAPASLASMEQGFGLVVNRLRQWTGLTEAGLFWFSYLGLLGLVAAVALA